MPLWFHSSTLLLYSLGQFGRERGQLMSCALAVQATKHGAITAFDLLRDRRLVASLIKEEAVLIDYSRQLRFESLEVAIQFYSLETQPFSNQ
jgi:hypothetical protein